MHLSKIIEVSIKMYFYDQRGNKKYLERKENESATVQNVWDTAKGVLLIRGKFRAIKSQETRKSSNNLMLHLKQLDKEEQLKPKVNRGKKS